MVTQVDSEAHRVAAQLGCEVADEETVVPVRRADIDYRVEPWDRSGWLLAQLLKLSAETLSTEEHVLVIDADTVLIRPQTFTYRGAVVALVSGEYHPPYFEAYTALFDERPPLAGVVHRPSNGHEPTDTGRSQGIDRTTTWLSVVAGHPRCVRLFRAFLLRGLRALRELCPLPRPVDDSQMVGEPSSSERSHVVSRRSTSRVRLSVPNRLLPPLHRTVTQEMPRESFLLAKKFVVMNASSCSSYRVKAASPAGPSR